MRQCCLQELGRMPDAIVYISNFNRLCLSSSRLTAPQLISLAARCWQHAFDSDAQRDVVAKASRLVSVASHSVVQKGAEMKPSSASACPGKPSRCRSGLWQLPEAYLNGRICWASYFCLPAGVPWTNYFSCLEDSVRISWYRRH